MGTATWRTPRNRAASNSQQVSRDEADNACLHGQEERTVTVPVRGHDRGKGRSAARVHECLQGPQHGLVHRLGVHGHERLAPARLHDLGAQSVQCPRQQLPARPRSAPRPAPSFRPAPRVETPRCND